MSGALPIPSWFDPEDDRTCRAAWSRLAEPGDNAAWGLVAAFGAGPALAAVIVGRAPGHQIAGRWRVRLPQTDPRADLAMLDRVGGRLLVPGEPQWPVSVNDLGARRPFCLWVRGPLDVGALAGRSVAVVGARASTPYGERLAADIAVGCGDQGISIVSGAAYGIDAAAHRATLSIGYPTMAVLACGVDRSYPRGNEALIERIAQVGAVVSEVPPGSSPTRWRFLERNRIIAAITAGTVVVEAAWRSGAVGTANRALDLGRPVGAVPGPVTSAGSAGCHRLLRNGATCVTDAAEVVELVSPIGDHPAPEPSVARADHDGLTPVQIRVLDALPLRSPVPLASLAVTAGLEGTLVAASVGRLEMVGLAEQVQGRWRRARPVR